VPPPVDEQVPPTASRTRSPDHAQAGPSPQRITPTSRNRVIGLLDEPAPRPRVRAVSHPTGRGFCTGADLRASRRHHQPRAPRTGMVWAGLAPFRNGLPERLHRAVWTARSRVAQSTAPRRSRATCPACGPGGHRRGGPLHRGLRARGSPPTVAAPTFCARLVGCTGQGARVPREDLAGERLKIGRCSTGGAADQLEAGHTGAEQLASGPTAAIPRQVAG